MDFADVKLVTCSRAYFKKRLRTHLLNGKDFEQEVRATGYCTSIISSDVHASLRPVSL